MSPEIKKGKKAMNENMEHPEMEDGMEDDLIVFETEDGEEVTFRVEDYLFYNGDEYAILSEVTEDEEDDRLECIVCKVESGTDENGEETEEFINVEDESLAEKLIELANNRLEEDAEE